jgi:hypothetical protein
MDYLPIKKITSVFCAEELSSAFDKAEIPFHSVSSVNWKKYPYCPEVKFRIAHNGDAILLNYKVNESDIKAVCGNDNGRIWEDSCVEFFITFNSDFYYNIECNCITQLLIATGAGRGDRIPLPADLLKLPDRWSSLGNIPLEGLSGEWELSLLIPKKIFRLDAIETFEGLEAKGNFYKCGDNLKTPHFLSWKPIKSETPDFHLPQFFGKLLFE